MDSDEREARMLAVEILTLINRGGCGKEEVRVAIEKLEEAARALRTRPRPAEATA